VRTPAGEVAGDEFVIAGGSWSPQISRDLGLRLPIQAGRGYTLTLDRPRQHLEICSICVEARIAHGLFHRCGGKDGIGHESACL